MWTRTNARERRNRRADEHLNNVWWRTDRFELLQGGMFRFRVPEHPEMSFATPMTWVALRTKSASRAKTRDDGRKGGER